MHGNVDKRSKRRLAQEAPTANDIAQSNAALQHIIGNRANRWTVDQRSTDGLSSSLRTTTGRTSAPRATVADAPTSYSSTARAPIQHERSASYNEAFNQVFPVPPNLRLHPDAPGRPPNTRPAPATSTGRSVASNVALAQPGLPSPAPTDGIIESPNLPHNALRCHVSTPSLHNQHSHTHGLATAPTNIVTHPIGRPHPSHPAHTSMHAASYPSGPSLTVQPHLQVVAPFSKTAGELLNQIKTMLETFPSANNPASSDCRRLSLLREAVTALDGSCIILNLIYCHYLVYRVLPIPFQQFDPICCQFLSRILGVPDNADYDLLRTLSHFPQSLETVKPDHMTMFNVANILHNLSTQWTRFHQTLMRLRTPPLVQDIVELLSVHSGVLQTTIFRVIARELSSKLTDDKGLRTLEAIHFCDKDTYNLAEYRRTHPEREQIYSHLSRVVRSLIEAEDSQTPPSFPSPHLTLLLLRRKPQSMLELAYPTTQLLSSVPQQSLPTETGPTANRSYTNRPNANNIHFFPRYGTLRGQPSQPEPLKFALHQAHLQSPIIVAKHNNPEIDLRQIYRYVVGTGLNPTPINMADPIQAITFPVKTAVLPTISPSHEGSLPQWHIDEGTRTYRVRCALLPPSGIHTMSSWVTTDTYWPDDMYLKINDKHLEQRRKLHHGKHLPIDITHLVREGQNCLQVTLNRNKKKPSNAQYILAVEIIGFANHRNVHDSLRRISTQESLNTIKRMLASEANDEIAITSSSVTITLFDPYSNCRIFDIPVRGSECMHRDCFDLENLLASCVRPDPDQPTAVDCWRCPICRGDVRPCNLVIDEFLIDVRAELASRDQLDTRAIVVAADGSWKPKVEKDTNVLSPNPGRRHGSAISIPTPRPARVIEVIELDD